MDESDKKTVKTNPKQEKEKEKEKFCRNNGGEQDKSFQLGRMEGVKMSRTK